jgi:DNA modification methylase
MVEMCLDQTVTEKYACYRGDCAELIRNIDRDSIGLSVFSPPFAELYAYSDSPRDMGNCKSYDMFFKQFAFLAEELHRVIMPGRICAIHCIDIPAMKERDGYIGLKDFPGDIIRLFQKCGFIYHSRHVIWKDPLTEATRTKALGLAHKQLCKDSAMCRSGLPDYLLAFRKSGDNEQPITHKDGLTEYHGSEKILGDGIKRSHNIWRAYASPVWMDIRQSETLNRTAARDEKDQKHICPLQLDVIERAVQLWSTEGDIVLTPFGGIGSEAYVAIRNHRKAILFELKDSYFAQAVKNCDAAAHEGDSQEKLF